MLYERVFKVLNESGIKYVVIGGIAVNLHGFARATGDLDIAISLTDSEISKFVKITKKLGLVPRLPVKMEDFADAKKREEWIQQKNMKVFSVYNPKDPMEHIDLLIHQVLDFDKMYQERVVMRDGNLAIPIASISNLIKLKEKTGRERDAIDIKALKKIEEMKK